ncbi:hypothetical protein Taro_038849 [Colocasia esculenta]|uniref:4-coumarate--CoA ligase n=1 Tax=Colocasia esculenta TaxID=4460 RepID=A0A843WH20_COLES|nr:hypothetical protein [Colocasia esculenta]
MDTGKPLDDQFSRLHPCMPVKTRIAIVGAGPSGLSAAYALAKLGYNDVTVFEKYQTVGGMCESAEIEGDGSQDLTPSMPCPNSAPVITHLARETRSELVEMDKHKLAVIDHRTGRYDDLKIADDYVSIMPLTLKLQDEAKNSGKIGVHALSDVAADPTEDFVKLHGFKRVPRSVAYGYTASGYGYVQDMPYAYVQEFTRTSMAGKIRRFKEGYMSMWHKLSQLLPFEVHCNTEVVAIKRGPFGCSVAIKDVSGKDKVMEFDKIIISGALPFRNGKIYRASTPSAMEVAQVLELNDREREVFCKVQTIDYYTTVFKIRGMGHLPTGFYYVGEFLDNPSAMGYPVAMQRHFADTDIFLFWSYGNGGDIRGETIGRFAADVVKSMGGQLTSSLQICLFHQPCVLLSPYHTDMKDGFYENLETQLQGFQNTYYVGGLMAFELTERNSSYAMAAVCRHFANDNAYPMFPYVKRLFPLRSNNEASGAIRELDAQPGIEFPDLPSLDSYLKFWGTHKIMNTKTIFTWINEERQVVNRRTYGELNENASRIAHKLLTDNKTIVKPGDRVVLIYLPGLEFVDAFFGCLRAKVVPVPVLPPDPLQRGGQALTKLDNVSKVCSAVAILSTSSYHAAVRVGSVKHIISLGKNKGKSSAEWPNLPWLHTDSWIKDFRSNYHESKFSESAADMPVETGAQPDDLCFLQFTSGSTGDAKGVMITHGGLIHNVKLMHRRYRSSSRTVLVSWLPQYHDMGLIGGLFTALVSGGAAILFSPMTFIKNPLIWLETMSMYRATHSAGPNFAFELLVRRLESTKEARTFDLSSLVFLMVAAEPVRQKTLKRFVEICSSFGVSQLVIAPGYGLAENCVFVNCAFGENEPILIDWQGRVCCGYVSPNDPDVDIKIVDPESGKELGDGQEGEIWINSPSAGIGYWGKQELSKNTFYNELEGSPGKKYTRTGDLGRVVDGKLFITGRIKDLIILGGRNIYSADVEKTVESSSEFLRPGCCAVIGVPEEVLSTKGISVPEASDEVGLVVIAEVKEGKPMAKEIIEEIKVRVAEEHGISVASVQLIKPKTICKTTSGKIRRFECLKQFTDGTLSLVSEPSFRRKSLLRSFTSPTCADTRTSQLSTDWTTCHTGKNRKEITEFLKGLVSEQTGIALEKVSITESLVSYGIDSIGVVRAAQKLTDFLGVPVGAVDIFTASCISDLASFSENLLIRSQSQLQNSLSDSIQCSTNLLQPKTEKTHHCELHYLGIVCVQFIALIVASAMLILPAYLSTSLSLNILPNYPAATENTPLNYMVSLFVAPLVWIMYIFFTCICLVLFENPLLQPNYALTPHIPITSMDFVKWWGLNKAREIAGKVLAVHLRGTIFLNWWFQMLGARIGSSVLIDTVDITDPSLVSVGDGTVIAEGALIQSHEVQNGTLRFLPIKIGRSCYVGPYTVIQKGSVLGEGSYIMPLQRTDEGKPTARTALADRTLQGKSLPGEAGLIDQLTPLYHFMGIYTVGLLSSLSAAILYIIYTQLSGTSSSSEHFAFLCVAGAFHWFPAVFAAYAVMIGDVPSKPIEFALFIAIAYLSHGIVFSLLTAVSARFLSRRRGDAENHLKAWLLHRLAVASHLRFAKLLTGTEAFCAYLRLMGAKVGRHCSIRAINPVTEPTLLSIADGVHLGDFSRVLPGLYSPSCFSHGEIKIQTNSVIGSQSLVLPGATVEENVILGALSVAPSDATLQRGGVYLGSPTPTMVKNTLHDSDERIEDMEPEYRKIVGNLATNLAATTMKVKSRYFHRIGVGGRGVLRMRASLGELPEHKIFSPGRCFPVVLRHSNSLSADDDARIDARGAAVRIQEETGEDSPLLDLTLKTGKAFYARTIADFAAWLVCGLAAREKKVERAPHLRDAVWGSLRNADSYAELHYYSNFCRLLRFEDGREMYAKFKLQPLDPQVDEDAGKVEPNGILPPETGAIPREKNDNRPLLFLANDFRRRVDSLDGVRYVFQLQCREIPSEESEREAALDCTRPWDEAQFPYMDVGEIVIDRCLTEEESEQLEFNPFLRCREVDVIRATSCSQSASIDHGRSLVYEICQRLRNGLSLPVALRSFLEQSDARLDLSTCPVAATAPDKDLVGGKLSLARSWPQTLWSAVPQPLLQTFLPYFVVGLAVFFPLKLALLMEEMKKVPLHWALPVFWVSSGIVAALVCVLAKWVLVGKKKEGDTLPIWGLGIFMDAVWQALRTVVGDLFMEMTGGSLLFGVWMMLMGAGVGLRGVVYVDSMGAAMNPDMVEMEGGSCVGREALLFGHIYEGEGGMVKYGKIRVGERGFVGSRAVVMPGVRVDNGGSLGVLSLAMKEEIVRSR